MKQVQEACLAGSQAGLRLMCSEACREFFTCDKLREPAFLRAVDATCGDYDGKKHGKTLASACRNGAQEAAKVRKRVSYCTSEVASAAALALAPRQACCRIVPGAGSLFDCCPSAGGGAQESGAGQAVAHACASGRC